MCGEQDRAPVTIFVRHRHVRAGLLHRPADRPPRVQMMMTDIALPVAGVASL
jgi:hypothetical protein